MSIQIVSPHLDDAALSCAEHIHAWRAAGHQTMVSTLFTEFGVESPSGYMSRFMVERGIATTEEYGKARRGEDLKAMAMMGVEGRHCGLPDAGFRWRDGRPAHESRKSITRGFIAPVELPLVDRARGELERAPAPDLALLPLGVGRHVDHLIAREAGRAAWRERCAIGYYLDLPYARNPLNHSPGLYRLAAGLRPSIKGVSAWKRNVLGCYQTQMPYLYSGRPRFPEILLLPGRSWVGQARGIP